MRMPVSRRLVPAAVLAALACVGAAACSSGSSSAAPEGLSGTEAGVAVDALNQFTTHTAGAVFAIPPTAGPGDWVGPALLS